MDGRMETKEIVAKSIRVGTSPGRTFQEAFHRKIFRGFTHWTYTKIFGMFERFHRPSSIGGEGP